MIRSLCAIAHLKSIVPNIPKLVFCFYCRPNINCFMLSHFLVFFNDCLYIEYSRPWWAKFMYLPRRVLPPLRHCKCRTQTMLINCSHNWKYSWHWKSICAGVGQSWYEGGYRVYWWGRLYQSCKGNRCFFMICIFCSILLLVLHIACVINWCCCQLTMRLILPCADKTL